MPRAYAPPSSTAPTPIAVSSKVVTPSIGDSQSTGTKPVGPNISPYKNPKTTLIAPAPARNGQARRIFASRANRPLRTIAAPISSSNP
jgi:hypothetical protein